MCMHIHRTYACVYMRNFEPAREEQGRYCLYVPWAEERRVLGPKMVLPFCAVEDFEQDCRRDCRDSGVEFG